jgi:hypothetical protein
MPSPASSKGTKLIALGDWRRYLAYALSDTSRAPRSKKDGIAHL